MRGWERDKGSGAFELPEGDLGVCISGRLVSRDWSLHAVRIRSKGAAFDGALDTETSMLVGFAVWYSEGDVL